MIIMRGFSLLSLAMAQASEPVPAVSTDLIQYVLTLIVRPEFTWTLAFSIVLFGLFLWIHFKNRCMEKVLGSVRRANAELAGIVPGTFSANFDRLHTLFLADPVLRRPWNQYTDSLLISPKQEGVRSSREPEAFFNDRLLSEAGINLRFYHAVPSYLVGLGLLCTFLGLVAALFIASMAMDRDPATIKTALQHLLQAASFKFVTSIAGLGSSILFSYGIKNQLMVWERELDHFNYALLEVAPMINAEAIAYEALGESQKQSQALGRIHSELAGQLASAIDDKLHDNLRTLIDPLKQEIAQVTQRLSSISHEAVSRMVQDFREQLFAATEAQMQQLVGGLSQTNLALERMDASITQSAGHFAREIGGATAKVYQTITTASEAFEKSLQPLHHQIDSLKEAFGGVDTRFRSQLELFSEVSTCMRESLVDFRATAAALEGATGPIQSVTQELDAVARKIHDSNEASMHALEQLARFSESLNLTAQQTRETWDVYRQRFEKVDEDLKGVVEQLGVGFRRYHDIVENFMTQLDQSLSQSTSVLSSSVQELAETMENIEARNKKRETPDV